MIDPKEWMCVAWAPHLRRSRAFADEIGCDLYLIHYLRFQHRAHAPFKYVLQTLRTLQILFQKRPRIIHVANPPFVCGLVVSLYCLLSRSKYILDHHTGAFARIWRWALPIQRVLAGKAASNIVTNSHWADIVHSWGGNTTIMVDPFGDLPVGCEVNLEKGFNLVYVNTFAPDEPLDAVLTAARGLPDVHFHITGDLRRASATRLEGLPPNVNFTGFLPEEEYVGLLRAADAVMALSTWDFTLQSGGCEAVSVGKPLITSDWPYLRSVFSGGSVFVANSAEGIAGGIREMRQNLGSYQEGIVSLRREQKRKWEAGLANLEKRVGRTKKHRKEKTETP